MSSIQTKIGRVQWPAAIHPQYTERCYYDARAASELWVGGLKTRNGVPRWVRIAACGQPVAVLRVDGAISWEHRWCRDRACYACARSRSRKLGEQLRQAMEARSDASLHFVTLTRPRGDGETAAQAWQAFTAAWATLRHTPEFRASVAGGVRAMEVTWSEGHARAKRRRAGWHVHAHLVVELVDGETLAPCPACDGVRGRRRCHTCTSVTHGVAGSMPRGLVAVLDAWTAIVAGSVKAQCAVPLDRVNVGQLGKYLTKMFELPSNRARELYEAAGGRRTIEGFGSWRGWRKWRADVEHTPHGWYSSSMAVVDIEALPKGSMIEFSTPGQQVEIERNGVIKRWRPPIPVALVPRETVLDALRRDGRPVWERVKDKGDEVEHLHRCETTRRLARAANRIEHPHHFEIASAAAAREH